MTRRTPQHLDRTLQRRQDLEEESKSIENALLILTQEDAAIEVEATDDSTKNADQPAANEATVNRNVVQKKKQALEMQEGVLKQMWLRDVDTNALKCITDHLRREHEIQTTIDQTEAKMKDLVTKV